MVIDGERGDSEKRERMEKVSKENEKGSPDG